MDYVDTLRYFMTFTAKKTIKKLLQLSIGLFLILVVGVIALNQFLIPIFERNQYPMLNSSQHRDIASYLPKPYVVLSGSMEPAIKTASVVFSVPKKTYNPGNIITFAQNGSTENLITHRIEFKSYPDGIDNAPVYITSGDANEEFDRWEVKNEDIVGRVFFSIPYVGYAVDFAKRPYGFLLLVIVPATIIIYEELKVLGREFYRFLKKFREDIRIKIFKQKGLRLVEPTARRGEIGKTYIDIKEQTINLSPKGQAFQRTSILIPVIGSALVLISFSTSFFFDIETSIGNIFGAADSFGPPLADHLVINEVMFDPPNSNACGSENDAEWLEIYNPTSISVNLDTWSVGDDLFTDDLPNVIIPAGGFAVVSDCTLANFNTIWSLPGSAVYIDLPNAIGNGLANGGEEIRLLNGVTLVDSVSYGTNTDAFSPSVVSPVSDHSIERDPDGVDTDTAADFVDRTTPTPGS